LAAFCREAELNYDTMRKCFQRKNAPDANSLARIASRFRVHLPWLITGESASNRHSTRIGKRLRQMRKNLGIETDVFAKSLGMCPDVLEFYEKGKWPLTADLLEEFARKFKISLPELLCEDEVRPVQIPDLKVFQATSTQNAPKIRSEDYRSIPLTESSIAAGQPIIQEDNIEDYVLLHVRAAGKRANLVASRVDGDSMEPMLKSGDIVVIDRDDRRIVANRIYAVFYEEGLTAKYVEKQKNLLILRPLNPISKVHVVQLNEHPDPIVGRVIGAWKEL
jgi:phage repressor protein C with HTH and peptisase S24 domain